MIVEMPEEIAAIFSDYRMNLLEVRDSDRYVFNNTDVQSVFEITREIFAGHFEKIQEKYGDKQMGSDLLTVVGQMTGSKELIRMSRNREVNSVCEALKKLKEEYGSNNKILINLFKKYGDNLEKRKKNTT